MRNCLSGPACGTICVYVLLPVSSSWWVAVSGGPVLLFPIASVAPASFSFMYFSSVVVVSGSEWCVRSYWRSSFPGKSRRRVEENSTWYPAIPGCQAGGDAQLLLRFTQELGGRSDCSQPAVERGKKKQKWRMFCYFFLKSNVCLWHIEKLKIASLHHIVKCHRRHRRYFVSKNQRMAAHWGGDSLLEWLLGIKLSSACSMLHMNHSPSFSDLD